MNDSRLESKSFLQYLQTSFPLAQLVCTQRNEIFIFQWRMINIDANFCCDMCLLVLSKCFRIRGFSVVRRHGEAFGDLPPQTKLPRPKLNYEALSIGGVFINFHNVKPPWTIKRVNFLATVLVFNIAFLYQLTTTLWCVLTILLCSCIIWLSLEHFSDSSCWVEPQALWSSQVTTA